MDTGVIGAAKVNRLRVLAAWLEWPSLGDSTGVVKVRTSAVALVCLALAACGGGGGGDKTFEGDGFSFTYPEDWEQREVGGGAAEVGNSISSFTFAPSRGANGLTVEVYRLRFGVTEDNIESVEGEVAAVTEEIFRQAGGRVTDGPTRVTIAGHPGYSATGTGMTPQGARVESRVNLLFDGETEYFLNCQYTPSGAEEMKQGCDQVVQSLRVE
jgi:hypothetical protein